jgi:hypothetical protein
VRTLEEAAVARKTSKRRKGTAARREVSGLPYPPQPTDTRDSAQGTAASLVNSADRGSVTCAWCGSIARVPARGRVPKWCSASCRHRAWEQRRAAASGLSAIEVVDRPVEVVHTVTRVKRVVVEPPKVMTPGTAEEWARLLEELAERLDRGTIYDRQLPVLRPAVAALVDSMNRRWG